MYAVRGMMNVTTATGRWILPAGRALWIPAGAEHGLEVRSPVWLHVLYLSTRLPTLPPWKACKVVNVSPVLREMIAVAVDLPWDYAAGSPAERFAQVLVDQLAVMDQAPVDLPQPRDARAQRIAEMARAAPADRRPLSALAPMAGASARTLERLFATETGISFGAWRHRNRMIAALELLARGESVAAAGFGVGFDNASSFVAAFKAMFGKTPGRYFDTN
ncbi:helix-turn-helix transcriptional regulator [soil metagenome]